MANLRVDKITSTETFETTGSVQFDGTDDGLTISDNAAFDLGTGDFTIEGWYYIKPQGSYLSLFDWRGSGGDGVYPALIKHTSGDYIYYYVDADYRITNVTIQYNTWFHVTVCRSSGITKLFLDGKEQGRFVDTFDYISRDILLGISNSNSNDLAGNISNYRVVKGRALHTTDFKPPMRELEVVPGTVLLACQSKTDTTLEKTGKTITANGNSVASELTPGILTPVPKAGGGSAITGSVEFDGGTSSNPGGYLTVPNTTDLRLGSSDFTVEAWVNFSNGAVSNGVIAALWDNTNNQRSWNLYFDRSGNNLYFAGSTNGSSGNNNVNASIDIEDGEWYHVAACRSGSTIKLFVNGVERASNTSVGTYYENTTDLITIGAQNHDNLSSWWKGFISNLRIVKGTALYTGDFIPPTRELKKVPGTVLLCCQDSNDPTQEATGKTISLNGIFDNNDVVSSGITTTSTPSNFTPQVGDDRKVTFEGVTKINSNAYFYLPTGDTVTRDSRSGRGLFGGAMAPSFNDTIDLINIPTMGNAVDFGDIFTGRYTGACSSSTRAVFGGGEDPSGVTNVMDFVTIATNSDAINFGDLTEDRRQTAGCSSSTRGLFGGGSDPTNLDVIDYVTIASIGDAVDFGNLTVARRGVMSCSSPVRGVWGGGIAPGPTLDEIDYVTIASTGNALDFGNLSTDRRNIASGGCSNQVRGVFAGGRRAPANANSNIIDYITIASTGNAQDFGDLSETKSGVGACSSLIRGVFAGGYTPTILNTLEYITIASTGDAQDFGDLTIRGHSRAGCSDSHGGLG